MSARNALASFERAGYAKDVVEEIAILLKDKDSEARCSALKALEERKAIRYIQEVQELSRDTAPCSIYDETGNGRVTTVGAVAAQLLKKWGNKN